MSAWVLYLKQQKPTLVNLSRRNFIGKILGIHRIDKAKELGFRKTGNEDTESQGTKNHLKVFVVVAIWAGKWWHQLPVPQLRGKSQGRRI